MGNSSSKLELRSFSFEFEISSCIFPAKRPKISKQSSQNLPKSSPEASKIEPGGLQGVIFKRSLT